MLAPAPALGLAVTLSAALISCSPPIRGARVANAPISVAANPDFLAPPPNEVDAEDATEDASLEHEGETWAFTHPNATPADCPRENNEFRRGCEAGAAEMPELNRAGITFNYPVSLSANAAIKTAGYRWALGHGNLTAAECPHKDANFATGCRAGFALLESLAAPRR